MKIKESALRRIIKEEMLIEVANPETEDIIFKPGPSAEEILLGDVEHSQWQERDGIWLANK